MYIIILTWVSWSWKTSLQKVFLQNWWSTPINYTTRKSRNDAELDEYVFINKDIYCKKIINWDFIEHTEYNWQFYGISKSFLYKEWRYIVVLDEVWRNQFIRFLTYLNIKYVTVFLEIEKETVKTRLINRWDDKKSIEMRLKDFDIMEPTTKCKIVDWHKDSEVLYKQLLWIE